MKIRVADSGVCFPTLSAERNGKDGARNVLAEDASRVAGLLRIARLENGAPGNSPSAAAPNFNRLAGIYRWIELASFGPWLERCRFAFLNELDGCRKALVLGDGDGRFTGRLLRVNQAVRIDAVDASDAMLRALMLRAEQNAVRVRTHCADIRQWEWADGPYDLIVSHFFLDCLTTAEVEALAEKVRCAVSPSAVWLVSEFAVPVGWFGRLVARPMVWGLYWAFGRLTELRVRALPNYGAALRSSGFRLEQRREWLRGLLVSELWRVEGVD